MGKSPVSTRPIRLDETTMVQQTRLPAAQREQVGLALDVEFVGRPRLPPRPPTMAHAWVQRVVRQDLLDNPRSPTGALRRVAAMQVDAVDQVQCDGRAMHHAMHFCIRFSHQIVGQKAAGETGNAGQEYAAPFIPQMVADPVQV